MNTTELLEHHCKLTAAAFELMRRKNADYAGKDGTRPFRNFELCEAMNLCRTEVGMAVRLSDKIQRLAGALSSDGTFQVSDETFDDTVLDAINYLVLISAHRKQQGKP